MPRYDEQLASLRDDLDEITEHVESINQQIAEWRSRADPLYQQIAADLEAAVAELDPIEPPEPAEANEHPDPLSTRAARTSSKSKSTSGSRASRPRARCAVTRGSPCCAGAAKRAARAKT
jgi:hypothetical protein